MTAFIDFSELPTKQAMVASAAWQFMLEHSECPTAYNIIAKDYIPSTTSKTTITNGLRGFWKLLSESNRASMTIPGIPPELEQAILNIYKELNDHAESAYTDKVTLYDKTIENQKIVLNEAQQDLSDLSQDLKTSHDHNGQLKIEAQENIQIISRLNYEVQELSSERNTLETSYTEGLILIDKLEMRIQDETVRNDQALREERKRYDLNDSSLKKRIDDLNTENKVLQKRLATLALNHDETNLKAITKHEQVSEKLNHQIQIANEASSLLKNTKKLLNTSNTEIEKEKLVSIELRKKLAAIIEKNELSRITTAEQAEKIKQLQTLSATQKQTNQTLSQQLKSLTVIVTNVTSQQNIAEA